MPRTQIHSFSLQGPPSNRGFQKEDCGRLLKSSHLDHFGDATMDHIKETRQGHNIPTLGAPRAARVFYQELFLFTNAESMEA